MKWLLVGLVALIAVAALVRVSGTLIAREHRATSRIVIARPIAEVWPVVRDLSNLPSYWSEIVKVERLPDRDGIEVWRQTMKDGTELPLLISEETPSRRLVTTIEAAPGAAFGGRWIYELEPGGDASQSSTQVTVTEAGWIDNKLFRVVSRIMGYHGTLDRYLRALGTRLGTPAAPVHVP